MALYPSALQMIPRPSTIWPALRERSKPCPRKRGALQSLRVRAQSQTHAAFGLAGSISLAFHICQPQEKTEPSLSSRATCFAESASHFTTWNQADAGCRPLRPPTPLWLRKLSMIPSRPAGIPIEMNGATALR